LSLTHFFFIMIPRQPRSTLFPYTTLFRSENYGEIVLESYLSSKLVTSDMDDYDINQMAIGFPMEDLEGRKIYYDLKPFEKVTSRLNGDVDREPEIVIGGENSQEDFEKYYYKDTKGFEDIKGNEVGYYSLVFYENT